MFILSAKEVKPCVVIKGEEELAKTKPGLAYRGKLFVQVGSYPISESDNAVKQCRQLLQEENSITTIIVKTSRNTTVWSHDEQLTLKHNPSINIKSNYWKKAIFAASLLVL